MTNYDKTIDEILEEISMVNDNFANISSDDAKSSAIYGKDGVMGSLEPKRVHPHELGIIEAIAKTQNLPTPSAAYPLKPASLQVSEE